MTPAFLSALSLWIGVLAQGGSALAQASGTCLPADEHTPFLASPSWRTLQSFGSPTGGDWSAVFQTALDALRTQAGSAPVLYVPSGTYDIAHTLVLRGAYGVRIVGADPATTTLRWTGAAGEDLFVLDSSTHVEIGRLTLDGQHTGRVALHEAEVVCSASQAGCPPIQGYGPYMFEYSDLVVTGFDYGIAVGGQSGTQPLPVYTAYPALGDSGQNNGNGLVRRVRFQDIGQVALALWSQNAISWGVWDSAFVDTNTAIRCDHGTFGVYDSYFEGNAVRDIDANDAEWLDVRGNVAVESTKFIHLSGSGSNANVVGNFIHAPHVVVAGSTGAAILSDQPGLLLLDNTILTLAGVPAVIDDHAVTAGGNRFSGPASLFNVAYRCKGFIPPSLQYFCSLRNQLDLGENVYGVGTPTPSWTMPPTPALSGRPVIELSAATTTAQLQAAIAGAPDGSVVHLRAGQYSLTDTLTVPGGRDVLIAGDGLNTQLFWKDPVGPDGKPVFDLLADSRASVRDLVVFPDNLTLTNHLPSLIRVHTRDQEGDVIRADQLTVGVAVTGVQMTGVDRTTVRMEHGGLLAEHFARVVGGGAGQYGRTNTRGLEIIDGSGAAWRSVDAVDNWGKVVLEGFDFETWTQPGPVSGTGYFTTVGGRYAVNDITSGNAAWHTDYPAAPDFVATGSARGSFTFANADTSAGLHFDAASSADVLVLGAMNQATRRMPPSAETGCDFVSLNEQGPLWGPFGSHMRLQNHSHVCDIHPTDPAACSAYAQYDCAETPSAPEHRAAFASAMLADFRGLDVKPRAACGATDVRIHRVTGQGYTGVWSAASQQYVQRPLVVGLDVARHLDGQPLWATEIQTSTFDGAHSNGVSVTPDGTTIVGAHGITGAVAFGKGAQLPSCSSGCLGAMDAAGHASWAIPAAVGDPETSPVAVDDAANVYAAGGSVVQSFDRNGDLRWAVDLASGAGSVALTAIATDGVVVAVAGLFDGTLTFGSGSIGPASTPEPFVALLKPDGGNAVYGPLPWIRGGKGGGQARITDLAVGRNFAIYASGWFAGDVFVDSFSATAKGPTDGFVLAMQGGVVSWGKVLSSADEDNLTGVEVDWHDRVIVAGTAGGPADLAGKYVGSPLGAGSADGVVAALDETGLFVWGTGLGGSGRESLQGLAVDGAGSVVLSGTTQSDPSAFGLALPPTGPLAGFVVKLDDQGAWRWAQLFPGDLDAVHVATDPKNGDISVLLNTYGYVDVGVSHSTPKWAGPVGESLLLAKLRP